MAKEFTIIFMKDLKENGEMEIHYFFGERFEGEYIDDKRHGKGVMYYHTGDKLEAEFRDGEGFGKGKYYSLDVCFGGEWVVGEFMINEEDLEKCRKK